MNRNDKRSIRCAIYTRKSSEEGLEQSFNSLDAQREACAAYVVSQRHEGWTALKAKYDDGGFSGGTMKRPALKRLLEDIARGEIDTVIVYKVDRLTRSLSDFAKIIDAFDGRGVSFVSVTQQFNTTSSMGRLTLNVLLSFAQFEREVTGERIRDKFAASKKKGMWMGGNVPTGYDVQDRKLLVNAHGTKLIREIFEHYLRLGCVSKLRTHLERNNVKSPVRISLTGRKRGGYVFSRGAIYKILNNRLYLGEIHHRGQIYPGQHEAIISPELWRKVAERLKANNKAHRERRSSLPSNALLIGLLFDIAGFRYTPTHTSKGGKQYRYYTNQATIRHLSGATGVAHIPAHDIETVVKDRIHRLLAQPEALLAGARLNPKSEALLDIARHKAQTWASLSAAEQKRFVQKIVGRVIVGQSTLQIAVNRQALSDELTSRERDRGGRPDATKNGKNETIELNCDIQFHRTIGVTRVVAPGQISDASSSPSTSLLKAIARARRWYEELTSGDADTIRALAGQSGMTHRYVSRILKCAPLAPRIVEAITNGRQSAAMTLSRLTKDVPLDWSAQMRFFGLQNGVR
jgi:site-specific DNA recombinase